ncbi:MAG: hypothetical protein JO361_00725 [Gammaproteobacteria bacterium]|nr:hypothetical protein [Gammaproteobacteria bacterium]
MKRLSIAGAAGALMVALTLAAPGAHAQERDRHGFGGPGRAERSERTERADHYDARYSHNHYYANRGAFVHGVPGTPYVVARGGGRYYYSGGVWYAPRGPGFVVVAAPVGVFVPVLPPFYTTLWVGGFPYYYANDTYYVWRSDENGYEVVDPPGEQDGAATTQAPPSDDLFIYPQGGQSADQQASDKYECHKWANSQTGFDPTQTAGGVSPDQLAARRADYDRAMRACLEGRGYSVR